ncbi:FUSC family protein [Caballeronia sp. PC1]|uniref:FUSC family protein n=1 Tax=Caballeronia sp. PC1 TaxID=2906765 RepID=UPI002101FB34|nr:FUSC family protein [Caballeronia sp. PC1]
MRDDAFQRYFRSLLGLVISMVIVLLASTIIFPSARPWLRNMLLRDLLRQASLACSTKLSLARLYLESHTRDLGHQLNVASAGELKAQASAAAWMFTILDFGHSIVELRVELQKLSDLRDDTRVSVQRLLDCIFSTFETPSADQVIVVRRGSRDAILALRAEFDARADRIQVRELRRLSAYLHFIDFKLGQLPSTSVVDRKEWLRRFLAWDADGAAS